MLTCDWCYRKASRLIPVEGERLCWPRCANEYLDQKAREGITVIEDGSVTTYRPGMAQPRAYGYGKRPPRGSRKKPKREGAR